MPNDTVHFFLGLEEDVRMEGHSEKEGDHRGYRLSFMTADEFFLANCTILRKEKQRVAEGTYGIRSG